MTSQLRTSQDQAKLGTDLDTLMESSQSLGINVSEDISKLRRDIHTSLARSIKAFEHLESGGLHAELSRELPDWLSKLRNESISLQKQVDIISSLYYSRISERERNVKDPHPRTYDWLFEAPKNACESQGASKILKWLRTGEDVFWLAGKAGSGKSVLMKYLYNHLETHAALGKWAAGRDLVLAGFFFWSAGTSMQKSQQGLLQSILMCILKQRPALIPILCPARWNARLRVDQGESWTKSELLEALTRLKADSLDSVRFCIFIDGMDEYGGEILDLLRVIKDLTTSGSIKICVSSRPWTVFENFFGLNGGKRILLQDLNGTDIWRFAYEELSPRVNDSWNKITKNDHLALVEEIVERSSGVFLWVFLVVRSLLRGMTNFDTAEELRARLRELPTELEEFFRHILDRGDKVYSKQAARLYILQLKAGDIALSSRDLAHFAEEDQYYALRDDFPLRHAMMVEQLDGITRTRVLTRCQDLLEFDYKSRLQFLHRTVKDFLETGDILDELTRRAGHELNGHLFICNSMLVQMKAILQHHGPQKFHQESSTRTLYPTAYFMRCFWFHTRKLVHVGQLSFDLIAALDETLCLFYLHSRSCCFCLYLWIVLSIGDYYEGWIADQAVREDVPEVLSLQTGKTKQIVFQNQIWREPPLRKALIYMRSDDRLTTIHELLRSGADPNEMDLEKNSIWKSYLTQLEWPSNYHPRMAEIEILGMLLFYGADPSFLFNKNTKNVGILSAIAKDMSYDKPMPSDFQQRVTEYLSVERPELSIRPSKTVFDISRKKYDVKVNLLRSPSFDKLGRAGLVDLGQCFGNA